MKIFIRSSFYIIVFFLFIACGTENSNDKIKDYHIDKNISVTDVPYVERLGIATSINAKINIGNEPKDLYILLSNYAANDGSINIIKHLKTLDTSLTENKKLVYNNLDLQMDIVHAPKNVELFRAHIKSYLNDTKNLKVKSNKIIENTENRKESVDSEKIFYLDENGNSSTLATVRKIVQASTVYGSKTLNIWVSNDSYGAGCTKIKCVTQPMVDALANTFLKEGSDNDIYDWVTNVYGEEWGEHSNNRLISKNNKITILLTDIGNDNRKSGGVIGYFFPKDSFKKENFSGSNEQIMFYADAVVFANSDGNWNINGYWAKEMVSTLAHEFQHMIQFYQKSVLLDKDLTDTWLNEMLSESTEDLVASKILHSGPRGVDYRIGSAGDRGNTKGRYPLFNSRNTLSLTRWSNNLANYSVVNSFGAFLLRNYGGARVLHDIMYSQYSDQRAIEEAIHKTPQGTGKTFNDLQREWGVAVLLSNYDHLGESLPRYNTGGYMPTVFNLSTYNLGSVNFFNYSPQPTFHSSIGTVESQGNYYYQIGTKLSGMIDIDLKLNGNTEATLIVK